MLGRKLSQVSYSEESDPPYSLIRAEGLSGNVAEYRHFVST